MLSLFDLFALLVLLTASFAWLNAVVFRLPSNIGLLLMGVAEGTPGVIDTALTLALLAAFVAIAFAAFFARASEADAPNEPQ